MCSRSENIILNGFVKSYEVSVTHFFPHFSLPPPPGPPAPPNGHTVLFSIIILADNAKMFLSARRSAESNANGNE